MTNEELAKAIQCGNSELTADLWLQVHDFIAMYAEEYLSSYPKQYRQLKEDCIQSSWFTVIDAANHYNEDGGASFVTYLAKCLRKTFRAVCFSGTSKRQALDPLNYAISLDAPIMVGNEETVLLENVICDKEQGQQTCYTISVEQQKLEDLDQWRTINQFLRNGIKAEDDTEVGAVFLYMLDNNCGYADALKAVGIKNSNTIRWRKNKAQKRLKQYVIKNHAEVKKLGIEAILDDCGMRQYSYKSFKESIFTSGVEKMVLDKSRFINKTLR